MPLDMRSQRSLRTARELGAERPHGERLKYMSGCRCTPCRASNSNYETERAAARRRGEWNGLIDAKEVRHHLIILSNRGIGRDTVHDLTGISPSTIDLYRTGKRTNIRAMNAKAILAIDKDAVFNDSTLIPARRTWERIRWLLNEGFTKTEIARRLGYKTRSLQFQKDRITAVNAMKIEKLYNLVRAGDTDDNRGI